MSTLTIAPSNATTTKTRLVMDRGTSARASGHQSPNLSAAAVASMESFSFGAYSPLGAPKFKLPGATIKKENDLRKTLNGIKHLYFERRYRQCATTCEELLSGKCREAIPLIRTFLYFYAAVSYDTLAQSMHNRSRAKNPMLEQAGELYQKALDTLPVPASGEQDKESVKTAKVHFSSTSLVEPQRQLPSPPLKKNKGEETPATPRDSRRDSMLSVVSWITGLNSHVDAFSDSDYAAHPSVKKPSPLRIIKNRFSQHLDADKEKTPESPTKTRPQRNTDAAPLTPPFDKQPLAPILKTPTRQRTPSVTTPPNGPKPTYNSTTTLATIPVTPTDSRFPGFIDSGLRARLAKDDSPDVHRSSSQHSARVARYNAELATFHAMLVAHVETVRKLLGVPASPGVSRTASAVPSTRAASRNMTDEERAARILRGRERGWQRERWDGSRYEELRNRALGDL
ncbi:uncharacterized protein BKA78DRAFT_299895 [Phyllosticta capitalensis]